MKAMKAMKSGIGRIGIMAAALLVFAGGCSTEDAVVDNAAAPAPAGLVADHPEETRLRNVRQLTFGGENAEAYFSPAGDRIIFQSTREPYACDQQFTMNIDGSDVRLVSTGTGRTTCGYFVPGGDRIIYASTHLGSPECPPVPDRSEGYVWPLYRSFDIFSARLDGSDPIRLTDTDGYDAEGTVSPDGSRIVFTSTRDGDLEIYTMNVDGGDQTRLTHELGYDGGAFFSPDGQWIVYRAGHPSTPEAIADYEALISRDLVRPSDLEIWIMRADGSDKRRLTSIGGANWAPFFHPNGRQIIFASDMDNENPRVPNFELYLIDIDGGGLERITYDTAFDGFAMFSPDGSQLIWGSNRFAASEGETNIFIADWVE